MNSLILKPTGSHYGRDWAGDDFVVLRDGEVAHNAAPASSAGSAVVLDNNDARQAAVSL
jgi:hypothetical protein